MLEDLIFTLQLFDYVLEAQDDLRKELDSLFLRKCRLIFFKITHQVAPSAIFKNGNWHSLRYMFIWYLIIKLVNQIDDVLVIFEHVSESDLMESLFLINKVSFKCVFLIGLTIFPTDKHLTIGSIHSARPIDHIFPNVIGWIG
jgi:hypothetical protein